MNPTHASVFFQNKSSGKYTNFDITPPPGTTASCDSAEWIVERPQFNHIPGTLLDYGVIQMTGTAGLYVISAGALIDMYDNNKLVSQSSFPDSSTLQCKYVSPLGKKAGPPSVKRNGDGAGDRGA